MKRTVTNLSIEQLEKRYSRVPNTRMAKLTREALNLGYSIACIKQEGLGNLDFLNSDIQIALESQFPKTSRIEIWGYTDMSQLEFDMLFVAYKEIPGGNLCTHSCFNVL